MGPKKFLTVLPILILVQVYILGKMAEASQREVVTIKMGHSALGFQENVCTWLRAISNRFCFTALPGTSLRDGHIFFWSTDFKVQSPARYVMRVPFTAQRVDSVPSPFPKEASGSCANLF